MKIPLNFDKSSVLYANEVISRALKRFGCSPPGGRSGDGWSGIAELQRCAYRYYLNNELQATPVGPGATMSTALQVGTYLHAFMAAHYIRFLPEGYPGWQKDFPGPMEFIDACANERVDVTAFEEAKRLMYGYLEHYSNEEIQPVAVEYEAGTPGIHTCRYDAVVWKDGGLWDLETKTMAPTTASRADAFEGWYLDGEIVGQVYAWKLANLQEKFQAPLSGVIINALIKSRVPEYRRMEVVIPEKVVEAYARDRQFWGQQREHYRRSGYWPKSLWGCRGIYDRCGFFAHCRDEDANLIEIRKP
jgi:hypothetical protein